ncbi:MAG: family 16 glycosylhydrolase, partial [Flavobacteriaceae bacterium]|nr:family 16 glycosylhydrolase [Flavobacteriaceae bacterium]
TKEYTSARLNSKFAFTYGKVEVRAKLPFGVGTWPAIWTLGQNITEPGGYWESTHGSVSWPACGEIDIMEHWGSNQNYIQSAMHTPSSHGNTVNKGGQVVSNVSDEFHVYTLEWTEEKMVFTVDGIEHYTYEPSVQDAATWPFDANQYILLNVAILPEIATTFTESAMEIDYVRVYQETLLSNASIEDSIPNFEFASPSADILEIKIPEEEFGSTITLFTSDGKFISTHTISETVNQINLSGQASGLYFIKVRNKKGSFYRQAIKE